MSKILWLDAETTGIDPKANDIVQLACLVELRGKVVHEQEFYMRPINGNQIEPEALKANGLKVEQIMAYPPATTVLMELRGMLGRYVDRYDRADKFVPAGFHVRFDLDFLRQTFLKTGDEYFGSWFFNTALDVQSFVAVAVARYGFRAKNFKLGTLCEKFEIELDAHRALSDVRATRQLYGKLGGLR